MKSVFHILALGAVILSATTLNAQQDQRLLQRIETIPVKAKVIGVLQGYKSLAVLQVVDIDSGNTYNLQPQDEILVEFFFGTERTSGEPVLEGVKAGDLISAQISGKHNPGTGQYDYRLFKYVVYPTEKTSSQKAQPPQK